MPTITYVRRWWRWAPDRGDWVIVYMEGFTPGHSEPDVEWRFGFSNPNKGDVLTVAIETQP